MAKCFAAVSMAEGPECVDVNTLTCAGYLNRLSRLAARGISD